jgi:hypothetical protein
MDIVITNACMYHFLANPQLKKKEGHRRRMMEDIAKHMVVVRTVNGKYNTVQQLAISKQSVV